VVLGQAATKHLAVLGRVGLVDGRRQGREMRYAVEPERLAEAARQLNAVAAQWDRRLAAIGRVAERSTPGGWSPVTSEEGGDG